jgi:predicted lipid-binding transport protein (Tim44 family)
MSKKLLVRTPVTKDGIQPAFDAEGKREFKTAIVEPWARKELESLNATRAQHLRHEFEEIEVDDKTGKPVKQKVAAPTESETETADGKKSGKKGAEGLV